MIHFLAHTLTTSLPGWPQSRRKKIPEFSKLLQTHNYTFTAVIATKMLAIWQYLWRFLAIFSLRMRKNGYFS